MSSIYRLCLIQLLHCWIVTLQRRCATPRLVTEISQLAELGDVMLTVAEIDEDRAQGAKVLWEDIQSQMECWQGRGGSKIEFDIQVWCWRATFWCQTMYASIHECNPPWVTLCKQRIADFLLCQLGVYLLGRVMPMQKIDIETRQTVQEQLKSDTSVPDDVWEPRFWQWQRGCVQRELLSKLKHTFEACTPIYKNNCRCVRVPLFERR